MDWEKHQVYQWLLLENYDEARGMINTWKESEKEKEILADLVKEETISSYLIASQPEWVASYITNTNIDRMTHEIKLNLLPLLPPEEISFTLQEWDLQDRQECLETEIELEVNDEEKAVIETFQKGLIIIDTEWIKHINWEDNDPSSYSTRLICDTQDLFERLPIQLFAAAACSLDLCPILVKCITILTPDKLAVLIPVFNLVEFVQIAGNLNHDEQCNLLRVATEEQKVAFLEKVPLEHTPIIQEWVVNHHINLYLQLEMVIDKKMRRDDEYQEQAQKLVENLERASARLPTAIKHNKIRWKKMLKALKTGEGSVKLTKLIKNLVEKKITQNKNIVNQIKNLRVSIYEQSRLNLSPPEEEEIPDEFFCGIYQTIMSQPVTAHGHTFDKEAISSWLENNPHCPICRIPIKIGDFKENEALKKRIQESGIET